jgi:hypothetical protein
VRRFGPLLMGVLRYHPKNSGDVHLCLRGVEDNVVVKCGTDVKLEDVHTVADLRALRKWPSRLRLLVDREPPGLVRVERV